MDSWRENVSKEAQNELDEIFEKSINIAEYFLVKNGEFYPFAIGILLNGEISLIDMQESDDNPLSKVVILNLIKCIKENKNKYKAISIVSNVNIQQIENDGIEILIEHSEGIAMKMIAPYEIKGIFRKSMRLGEIEALSTDKFIWNMVD